MNLTFGGSYILTTKGGTISKKVVTVVAITNYTNAQLYTYNIGSLAFNEKVITDQTSTTLANLFNAETFFICNDNDGNTYIVWPDIIDSSTTPAHHSSTAVIKIVVDNSVLDSDQVIFDKITAFITNTYGLNVKCSILNSTTINSSNSIQDQYEALLKESLSVLQGFQSLQSLIPFLNAIKSLNLTPQLTSIQSSIATINSSIVKIAATMK